MRRRLLIKTVVVSVLVAVAVSIAVVVARGSGEGHQAQTASTAGSTPSRLPGGSSARWVGGAQPLRAANQVAASDNSACPKRKEGRRLPADFPTSFPLPKGTVVTTVRRFVDSGVPSVVYVIGFAPLTLLDIGRFYLRELPRSGYHITASDAEAIELEARFEGPQSGAFKALVYHGCSRAVWLLVGVRKPAS